MGQFVTVFAKPVEIVGAIVTLTAAESSRSVAMVRVSGGYPHLAVILIYQVVEWSLAITSKAGIALHPLAPSALAVVYLSTALLPFRRSLAYVAPNHATPHALLLVDIEQYDRHLGEWGKRLSCAESGIAWELCRSPLMAFYGGMAKSGKLPLG